MHSLVIRRFSLLGELQPDAHFMLALFAQKRQRMRTIHRQTGKDAMEIIDAGDNPVVDGKNEIAGHDAAQAIENDQ